MLLFLKLKHPFGVKNLSSYISVRSFRGEYSPLSQELHKQGEQHSQCRQVEFLDI